MVHRRKPKSVVFLQQVVSFSQHSAPNGRAATQQLAA
jgi:hypothetical protein